MQSRQTFYVAFGAASQVDRAKGVISGVSVITEGPALGHGMLVDKISLSQVLAAAKQYSGGLQVVDRHTSGSDSIFATVGALKNFRIDGAQLRADLHLLKSEPSSEKLFEMAETMPDSFGLSIAFSGEHQTVDGNLCARCSEIYNAALVGDPAANPNGLFSRKEIDARANGKVMPTEEEFSKFSKSFSEFSTGAEARFAAIEKSISDLLEASKKPSTDLAALQTKVTELSAAVETAKTAATDRVELARTIAKEFASATGTRPAAGASPTELASAAEKQGAEKFVELAKKHFAGGKITELQATKLAMNEDPKAYAAFRVSGLQLKLKA